MKISEVQQQPSLKQEILLSHILQKDRSFLSTFSETEITTQQLAKFKKLNQRLNNHEPLAYILGNKEFYGRKFLVNKDVLIPRPETEDLVEAVLDYCAGKDLTVVDVGTGSGAIAITLRLQKPRLNIIAIDKSTAALKVARKNARLFGLDNQIQFIESDLLAGLTIQVDIIVANLPYIPTKNWAKLDSGIKDFEPKMALDSGKDALNLYNQLFNQAKKFLKRDGRLFYELDGDVLVKDCSEL